MGVRISGGSLAGHVAGCGGIGIVAAAGIALTALGAWFALAPAVRAEASEKAVRVGSKKFTESVVLGEIAAQAVRAAGSPAVHRRELGGTTILWNALLAGEIDVYPEYTGTIAQEILSAEHIAGEDALREACARRGIAMSRSLGFNDTYALGMKEETAARLGIRTLSDLAAHPDLSLGFSNEFLDRADGWAGLRKAYGLTHANVRGLDHDLAYRGLDSGTIAVTDLYSTDAEISFYRLRVLEDDRAFFPAYRAVWLVRADLADRAPRAADALRALEEKIAEKDMIAMNARAKLDRVSEERVASDFLSARLGLAAAQVADESLAKILLARTFEHILLVALSLAASILVAVPLGIFAARRPRAGQVVLAIVGIFQTIPSLALLVFMIPLLGIGAPPALFAMFLYSLLPIVRNTYTGLRDIPLPARESAEALGLPPGARLRLVELPMASRAILAGIKTSAVINVGTATLGALIGAGGYGQLILTGIRLADNVRILEGAVPAALLALAVQGLFEAFERLAVPRGLRLS
jgi:osmoprotectant transport system permease protein